MSRFSGKCDLADDFFMNEELIRKENPELTEVTDMDLFNYFKKVTGGVLYQHYNIEHVTDDNKLFVKEHCENFDYKTVEKTTPSGKVKKETIYTYYGREYTEKELKKKGGVFIKLEIHFDTLLDLIPYFPYLITMMTADKDGEIIYITRESYVDTQYKKLLDSGFETKMYDYYKKELQNYTRDITLKYFNPIGREVAETLEFDENRQAKTSHQIDYNFEPKRLTTKSHWTSPKIVDSNTIEISKDDYDTYLGTKVSVFYVKTAD